MFRHSISKHSIGIERRNGSLTSLGRMLHQAFLSFNSTPTTHCQPSPTP
jgi:hypothetical protein